MEIDLKRLRHVVTVGRVLSFSRAAEELRITQPALSRSIASLEKALDVRIFDRDRSGVVVTPIGARLIADAQRLLSQSRILEHNLIQWRGAETGSIKFGIGPLAASMLLPTLLSKITTSHPQLIIEVRIDAPHNLINELEADQIEFCVCVDVIPPPLGALEKITIGQLGIGLFVRAEHPLANRPQIGRDDLYPFSIASGSGTEKFYKELSIILPKMPNIICDNYHILKNVMLESDAIIICSRAFLIEEIKIGNIVKLDVIDNSSINNLTISAFRLLNRTASPAAKILLDIIEDLSNSEEPCGNLGDDGLKEAAYRGG